MSEKVRNLLEAGTASHQAAGYRVTKDVGALEGRIDPRTVKRTGRGLRNGMARERLTTPTPQVLDEYSALSSGRTTLAQVAGDSTTGLARQWQHGASASLACSHLDDRTTPIDVLQM